MNRRRFLALTGAAAAAALLPGASARAATSALPRPQAGLVTRWDRDPWARGSYSALAVGCSPRVRRVLRDTVISQRVVFAGEYASIDRPATTTGAEASGRYAARRLLAIADPDSVIVIGAGIAGAAAAQALDDAGVQVTVLEARDRIGGRILSNEAWGAPIELGAGWVHGLAGNPIAAQARECGLRLIPTDYEDEIVRDTVTGRESEPADIAQTHLQDLVDTLGEQESPVTTSVSDWLSEHDWSAANRFSSWAQATTITQEYGLDPSRLAARALQEGSEYSGGDALVAGAYAAIPERMLDGIDVRLRTPVRAIEPGRSGVTVRTDQSTLSADAVIVAVPVAVLQAGVPRINGMPPATRRAIASLSTGNLEKVVLRYDTAWWEGFDAAQVYGVVGGGAPGAPAGSQAALRWTEFYPLTELVGFPALVGFAGGSAARTRPASDAACIAEAVAALDAAFRS